MQPRVLRMKLPEKLLELVKIRGINFSASSIGISRGALDKILKAEWDSVSRSVVERICDRFDLEISELFELVPSRFWDYFATNNNLAFVATTISRQPDASSSMRVNLFDQRAMVEVRTFLEKNFDVHDYEIWSDVHNKERLFELVKTKNTIIIGAPRSNPATEILLCRLFNLEPFTTAPASAQVPFSFIWSAKHQPKEESAFSRPFQKGADTKLRPGIALYGKRLIVEVDWLPKEQYNSKTLKNKRDCGFIVIVNKPFETPRNVKLVLIGGYSGLGTWAAAKALIRDFRNLEPEDDSAKTIGVFEVRYDKMHETRDEREIKKLFWKYLVSGRMRKFPS